MHLPMNVISRYLLIGLVFVFASCSPSDPKSLARKYCACFKEAQENPQKLPECAEIARENQEILGKDEQKSRVYGEEIIRCAIYNYPEK